MTTRIMMLRSRAANPSSETPINVPPMNTVLPPQTERRPVSYRDAVVSRPTSPANSADGNQAPSNGDPLVSTTSNKIGATNPLDQSPSQDSLQDWDDDNPNPWIRVGPRKTRSLESLSSRANRPSEHARTEKETDPVVRAAEKQLTNAQKELIARRNKQVTIAPGNSSRESTRAPEAGTSKNKGKIIDPREWGNLDLDKGEVDLQAQEAALESYKLTLAQKKKELKEKALLLQIGTEADKNVDLNPASRSPEPNRRVQRKEKIARVPESRPVDQIAPDSYLGKALEKLTENRRDNPDDDPSSSSSESSSSPSLDSEQEPRTSRRKKRKSKKKSRTTLKPIPPSEYDGSADARAYHRFITEGTAYLVDGKVRRNRRVFVLSYYLKGKAYDFYTQKISMNNEEWNLKEFFQAMFDYCFPVNYRTEQRDKLKRTYQNNKTVVAFVYELEELYNMIGSTAERDKVLKLWYGLRTSIQQALWRDGFNPEISSWDEVINGAEIIEISEGVTTPRNRHQPEVRDQSNSPRSGPSRRHSTFPKGTHFERQTPTRGDSQPPSREQSSSSGKPNNRQRSFSGRHPSRGFSNHPRPYNHNNNSRQNTSKPDQPKSSELSEKERSELLAEGRCFRCKEKGHLSRNCPTGNSVRSNDKRPPGVSNYNIEFEIQEDEEVQILDNLELGMMEFEGLFHYPQNWGDFEPDWMKYDPSAPRQTEFSRIDHNSAIKNCNCRLVKVQYSL